MNTAVMFSHHTDEWSTPDSVYQSLHAEFGFGLDAAAAENNATCHAWFSKDTNALVVDWYAAVTSLICPGTIDRLPAVWLNPPYSQCRAFLKKAAEEARAGCTVVCLVPSRTDTRWWHDYVWDQSTHQPRPGVEIRFVKGRLKFGDSKQCAPFPSVVIIFRLPKY